MLPLLILSTLFFCFIAFCSFLLFLFLWVGFTPLIFLSEIAGIKFWPNSFFQSFFASVYKEILHFKHSRFCFYLIIKHILFAWFVLICFDLKWSSHFMWYQQQDLGHVHKSSCFVLQDGQLSPSNHTVSLPPCCLCSADPAYLQPNFPLMQRLSPAFSDVHARTVWLWSQKGQPNPLQGGWTEVHHGGRHPDHQQGWQQLVAGPGGRLIPGVSGPDPLPWAAGMVSHWWTRTHAHHRELPSFHNLSCCVSFLLLNGANLSVFLAQGVGGRGDDAIMSLTGCFMAKGAWLVLPASTDLCGHKCFPSACKAGRGTGT